MPRVDRHVQGGTSPIGDLVPDTESRPIRRNASSPSPAVLILGFGWVKGWSGRVLGGCCGREVSPLRHRGWEVRFCGGGSALPRRRSLIHRLHGGSRHPDRLLAPLLRGAA